MCGGRVLIKHGGIFNEGCNKRQIASIISVLFFFYQSFICVMQVFFVGGVDYHTSVLLFVRVK